jgi:hypothetical protein
VPVEKARRKEGKDIKMKYKQETFLIIIAIDSSDISVNKTNISHFVNIALPTFN